VEQTFDFYLAPVLVSLRGKCRTFLVQTTTVFFCRSYSKKMPSHSRSRVFDGADVWMSKAAAKAVAEKQKKGSSKARRRAHAELVDIGVNGCRAADVSLDAP